MARSAAEISAYLDLVDGWRKVRTVQTTRGWVEVLHSPSAELCGVCNDLVDDCYLFALPAGKVEYVICHACLPAPVGKLSGAARRAWQLDVSAEACVRLALDGGYWTFTTP